MYNQLGKARNHAQSVSNPAQRDIFQPLEQKESMRITDSMSPQEVERVLRRRAEWRQAEQVTFNVLLIQLILITSVGLILTFTSITDPFSFSLTYLRCFAPLTWPVSMYLLLKAIRRFYTLRQNSIASTLQREKRVQSEIEQVKALLGYTNDQFKEKPKNEPIAAPIHLTDDGEFMADDPESIEADNNDQIGFIGKHV